MAQKRILVIEDDALVRQLLIETLEQNGFQVVALPDGGKLEAVLDRDHIDLAIFDVMLPGADGLELMRRLRERSNIGVIILSGMGELTDRVVGLELGADDYLAKPFAARELVARVRSLLRRMERFAQPRGPSQRASRYSFEGWILEPPTHSLQNPEGETVALTDGDFALLEVLLQHANQAVAREALLQAVASDDDAAHDARSVDVRIGRLRRKLRDSGRIPRLIRAVRGVGYAVICKVETR